MTWLIAGLGNPGAKYASTRHNVGFMVADELARRARASFSAAKPRAEVAKTIISKSGIGVVPGESLLIVKPLTFMNESGQAVGALARFNNISADHIIVVHDELDLDLGRLKMKLGGSDNGHNGLKSVRAHLSTGDFLRVRFGIGRPPGRMSGADYVLGRFSGKEQTELELQIQLAADACEAIINQGLAAAQNRYNS